MYIEELLEVAVGLIFIWLLLSMATMSLQEWIASLGKYRAKDLQKTIRGMLEESSPEENIWKQLLNNLKGVWQWILNILGRTQETQGETFVDKLYQHQLIRSLSENSNKPPSYIPSNSFAIALFDVVMTAGADESLIQKSLESLEKQAAYLTNADVLQPKLAALVEQAKHVAGDPQSLVELKKALHNLATDHPELKAPFDSLLRTSLPTEPSSVLDQVKRGAEALAISDPRITEAIHSLLMGIKTSSAQAEEQLAAAQSNVESWFNNTMDRLTGWYKRRTQRLGLVLGLVLAIMLNCDSMAIGTVLWREPAVRQVLVENAADFDLPQDYEAEAQNPEEIWDDFSQQFVGLRLPLGWASVELPEYQPGEKKTCSFWPWQTWGESNRVDHIWGLPRGGRCIVPVDTDLEGPRHLRNAAAKALGIAISGLAAAQGAPFWFDVLKKIMNVRGTGKKPGEDEQNNGQKK